MNKRAFLGTLVQSAAFFLTPWRRGEPALPALPALPDLIYVWVDEPGEIVVAPSLDALNQYLGRGTDELFSDELLTPSNHSEIWGYVDENTARIYDEDDDSVVTLASYVEELKKRPWFQARPIAQLCSWD